MYPDFAGQTGEMYFVAVEVVSLVVGARVTISRYTTTWQDKLRIRDIIDCSQLATLFGDAHVLSKVLCP